MVAPVTECQNCAFPDTELVRVRRVYLHPGPEAGGPEDGGTLDHGALDRGALDRVDVVDVVDEPEWWCVSCVSQYPCEIAPSPAD